MKSCFDVAIGNQVSFLHEISGFFNLTSHQVMAKLNLPVYESSHMGWFSPPISTKWSLFWMATISFDFAGFHL